MGRKKRVTLKVIKQNKICVSCNKVITCLLELYLKTERDVEMECPCIKCLVTSMCRESCFNKLGIELRYTSSKLKYDC